MTGSTISFGSFQLDPTRLQLSEAGERLNVGARACALLLVLVQRRGEIVSSSDLLRSAWPGVTVDEVNIRVHVTALRKVLRDRAVGAQFIHTVPRRGYQFVGGVDLEQPETPVVARPAELAPPQLLTPLIGRGEAIEQLVAELSERRIVTVVGPGGIGKTALVLATAGAYARESKECVFVDLATAATAAHVAEGVFAALALTGAPEDLVSYIVAALRDRSLLLIFDNCDQVVDAVAGLANSIAGHATNVRILATSREPLRAHGEHVHALGPLQSPSVASALTADSLLDFSAARLFVGAARSQADGFRLDDGNAELVGEICRKLDGIPLALELAAAMTDLLTIRELAERLDDRFTLLTRGRRTAPPRHRTMLDALEWGHTLLTSAATVIMRRLAVFPSRFSLKDAVSVATDDLLSAGQVLDAVAELQTKSLLTVDISGDAAEFRFLETIRAYAIAKLRASGERDVIHRRHALLTLETLLRMREQRASPEQRLRDSRRVIDDLRTAHNWAASPGGDRLTALHLLSVSSAVWRTLNLDLELITRARETLVGLRAESADSLAHEMNVQLAVTFALNATQQHVPSVSFQRTYWTAATRALELAERVGGPADRIRAMWSVIGACIDSGRHNVLMDHAAALGGMVTSLPPGSLRDQSTYLCALAYHSVGQLAESQRVIGADEELGAKSPTILMSIGARLSSRSLVARNLWLQGEIAAARDLRAEGMAKPLERLNPSDVLFFLTSCGLSFPLWDRDIAATKSTIDVLERIAAETGRPGYRAYVPALHAACQRLQDSCGSYGAGPVPWSTTTTSHADAMTGIHCSFHRPEDLERIRVEPNWAAAEHLRSAGEHVLIRGGTGCEERAFTLFGEAAAVAAGQKALFWELRAAVSVALLHRRRGDAAAAQQAVAGVVERFSNRETCADLVDAQALLAAS